MKKFAQTAILIAGLAGLSACASSGSEPEDFEGRTAGSVDTAAYYQALEDCRERVARLEEMNKQCYRK